MATKFIVMRKRIINKSTSIISIQHKELTEKIIAAAYDVYNKMGFGFLESIYEKCLLIELRKRNLKVESQKPVIVKYENEVVGEFRADIIVEDIVIIELKSVR